MRAGKPEGERRRTLLPPLDDELVLKQIWPLLHKRINVSLLWRLRRVNRVWKERIETTIEWATLEMVRVDAPGYLRYLSENRERRPSLHECAESELKAFTLLLAEDIKSLTRRSETVARRQSKICYPSSESERHRENTRKRRKKYESSASRRSSIRREVEWNEEEEIEAYMSSTDSSMRVYYPRHVVR